MGDTMEDMVEVDMVIMVDMEVDMVIMVVDMVTMDMDMVMGIKKPEIYEVSGMCSVCLTLNICLDQFNTQ